MKPLKFCLENSMEIFEDEFRKTLTAEARQYAEDGKPPKKDFGEAMSYWDGVLIEHKRILWMDAYNRRKARLVRLKEKT